MNVQRQQCSYTVTVAALMSLAPVKVSAVSPARQYANTPANK